MLQILFFFFFSSRRRHTRYWRDWSSDVCSSDLPGTGLGMACLVSGPAGLTVVTSEGGHASLAGIDAETDRIIAILRRSHAHVSAELVLSGPGLVRLYQAI